MIVWGLDAVPGLPNSTLTAHTPEGLIHAIDSIIVPDLSTTPPAPNLRYRHVIKEGVHYYLFSNEGLTPLETTLSLSSEGQRTWLDPFAMTETEAREPLKLAMEPYTLRILKVSR